MYHSTSPYLCKIQLFFTIPRRPPQPFGYIGAIFFQDAPQLGGPTTRIGAITFIDWP